MGKINHLLFMDDLKLYAKSERGLDSLVQTVNVLSSDIVIEFWVKKCMCYACDEKRKTG